MIVAANRRSGERCSACCSREAGVASAQLRSNRDSPILFLLTDEDSRARKAIERLQDPKVVSPQPIWVFCREDKRPLYEALARGEGGSDLCSGTDLGELEGGSGPGPLPSRSRLLDLLPPARFPAAETAICAPTGETPAGLQPGGSQLLLSEGQS